MYRVILLPILIFALIIKVQAQSLLPTENTLNTTGNTLTGSNSTFSYSVGEVCGFSLQNCSFTQGVIQPGCLCLVPVNEAFDRQYKSRFYPNPTSDQIIVETDFNGFTRYAITTLDGREVATGKFDYSPIGFSAFPSGMYVLQLASENAKNIKSIKIIKQ